MLLNPDVGGVAAAAAQLLEPGLGLWLGGAGVLAVDAIECLADGGFVVPLTGVLKSCIKLRVSPNSPSGAGSFQGVPLV